MICGVNHKSINYSHKNRIRLPSCGNLLIQSKLPTRIVFKGSTLLNLKFDDRAVMNRHDHVSLASSFINPIRHGNMLPASLHRGQHLAGKFPDRVTTLLD